MKGGRSRNVPEEELMGTPNGAHVAVVTQINTLLVKPRTCGGHVGLRDTLHLEGWRRHHILLGRRWRDTLRLNLGLWFHFLDNWPLRILYDYSQTLLQIFNEIAHFNGQK